MFARNVRPGKMNMINKWVMRLVDVDKFYQHADVYYTVKKRPMGRFGDQEGFVKSMDRLLLNLVQRLPEEEQFMPWTNAETQNKVVAEFLFGPKLHVTTVWEHLCRGDATYFMDLKADGNPPPPDTVANMIDIASSPTVNAWQQSLRAKEFTSEIYANCFYDLDSPFFVVNILTNNIEKLSDTSYRVYLGPFKDLKSLKKAFNDIKIINFENIEIIKTKKNI